MQAVNGENTQKKETKKERIKEEANNQGTIRHFQPDMHLNICRALDKL